LVKPIRCSLSCFFEKEKPYKEQPKSMSFSFKDIPSSCFDGTWSFEDYEKFRSLKNEAKHELSLNYLSSEKTRCLEKVVNAYHAFVEKSHALSQLKEFRRALKRESKDVGSLKVAKYSSRYIYSFKGRSFYKYLKYFKIFLVNEKISVDSLFCGYEMFDDIFNSITVKMIMEIMQELAEPNLKKNRVKWKSIRDLFVQSLIETRQLGDKKIEWLTGSQSSSIIMMKRIALAANERLSLLPTGEILKRGFVSVCGELLSYIDSGGISSHVNFDKLSGVTIDNLMKAKVYAVNKACSVKNKEELAKNIDIALTALRRALQEKITLETKCNLIRKVNSSIMSLKINLLRLLYLYGVNNGEKQIINLKVNEIIKLLPEEFTRVGENKKRLRLCALIEGVVPKNVVQQSRKYLDTNVEVGCMVEYDAESIENFHENYIVRNKKLVKELSSKETGQAYTDAIEAYFNFDRSRGCKGIRGIVLNNIGLRYDLRFFDYNQCDNSEITQKVSTECFYVYASSDIDKYLETISFDIAQVSEKTQNQVSDILGNVSRPSCEERLEEMLKSMDTVQCFDESSINMIEQSFPIIWVSTTLDSTCHEEISGAIFEKSVKGPLELSKDIQIAATYKEHIEELREMLIGTGVRVISIETLYHLQNLQKDR
jgi:hypothetical protein